MSPFPLYMLLHENLTDDDIKQIFENEYLEYDYKIISGKLTTTENENENGEKNKATFRHLIISEK